MRNIIAVLLLSTAALGASAKNKYIPVAGRAVGANNTLFRTGVRIFNPSSTDDISVSIHSCPRESRGATSPVVS